MTPVPVFVLCASIVVVRPIHFDGHHILAIVLRSPDRDGSQPTYQVRAAELRDLPEIGE